MRLDEWAKAVGSPPEGAGIKATPFRAGKGYLVHFLVNSGTHDKLRYDAVVRLSPPDGDAAPNLDAWNVRAFSNSPSFAYPYAFVYKKLDLLDPDFEGLLPEVFLKTPPKRRNPKEEVGPERTLAAAADHLLSSKLRGAAYMKSAAEPESLLKRLVKGVPSFEEVMRRRSGMEEALRRRKARAGRSSAKTRQGVANARKRRK